MGVLVRELVWNKPLLRLRETIQEDLRWALKLHVARLFCKADVVLRLLDVTPVSVEEVIHASCLYPLSFTLKCGFPNNECVTLVYEIGISVLYAQLTRNTFSPVLDKKVKREKNVF